MTRLPPLNSLRAFDAAARHLSFKLAAEELCVTPTAISHHVKALEDQFGVKLFHRLTRSLTLTAEGALYAPFVQEAFDKLTAGSVALGLDDLEGELVVSTTRSFANTWLSPRLPKFKKANPDLAVRLYSSDDPVDFQRLQIDIAVRYGFGHYPDLHSAWVLDDFVAPVCAPDFPLSSAGPETLIDQPLISYEWGGFSEVDPNWNRWLSRYGITSVPSNIVATYSDEQMCLQAAIDGHGVALVSMISAARNIEDGSLIVPFEGLMKNKSYYLVCPKQNAGRKKVQVFQDWLLDEVDEFRESTVGCRFFDGDQNTLPVPD